MRVPIQIVVENEIDRQGVRLRWQKAERVGLENSLRREADDKEDGEVRANTLIIHDPPHCLYVGSAGMETEGRMRVPLSNVIEASVLVTGPPEKCQEAAPMVADDAHETCEGSSTMIDGDVEDAEGVWPDVFSHQ